MRLRVERPLAVSQHPGRQAFVNVKVYLREAKLLVKAPWSSISHTDRQTAFEELCQPPT